MPADIYDLSLLLFSSLYAENLSGYHIRRLGYKGPKRSFGAVKIFLEGTAVFVWGHAHNIFEIRVETAGIVLIPYLFGNKRNRIVRIEQKISCLTNPYFVKIIMEGNREILFEFPAEVADRNTHDVRRFFKRYRTVVLCNFADKPVPI